MIEFNKLLDMMNDLFIDEELDESLPQASIDIKSLPLSSFSSEKLCAIIASCRYLSLNKQLEVNAMEELSSRRTKGDLFEFESEIDRHMKKFIPIDSNPINLSEIVKKYSHSGGSKG